MKEKLYKGPPKTAAELKRRIDKYFESRTETVYDEKRGKENKTASKPCTLTGFALALGLESREELYSFKDPKMQTMIKQGLLRIEEYAEEKLFSKEAFSGVKLFLSVNFDRWRDIKNETAESETAAEIEISEDMKKWSV